MNGINLVSLQQLKANASWYLALGVILILLGALALGFSYASTLFSVIYFGIFLITIGVLEAIQSFKLHKLSRFFLHAVLSALYIMAGVYIVNNPALNAITLTALLAWFFIVSGILKTIFSFVVPVPHSGWLTLSGLLTLALGVMIWQQWPASGLWVIGMFLGIDTLMTGWNWVLLALAAKNVKI